MATKKGTELKDNSIKVSAFLKKSVDAEIKEDKMPKAIKQLQVFIDTDELDGLREEYDHMLHKDVILTITPTQTELSLPTETKEAKGQTKLDVEEDGTKTPKKRAQDEKKAEA